MAISLRGTATGLTAAADTATPFANVSYTLPTGHANTDLLVALLGVKWSATGTYGSSQTQPTDYTLGPWRNNGTTASGNGTGSVWGQIAYKIHDGSEANPAQTFSGGYTPAMLGMIAFQNGLGGWNITSTTGADNTTANPFDSNVVASPAPAVLDYTTGDWALVLVVHKDDTATHTSPSLTITGCTVANLTERLATNTTTTGNDGAMYLYTADITSGTASAAPRFQATTGGTGMGDGVALFLRIREAAPPAPTSIQSWGFLPIS